MTQKQLRAAIDLSLSLNSIGHYERGERSPDFEDLRKIAAALAADHFEVDDNIRIEFGPNGKPRSEPLPQQLNLDFDENGGVTVRIQSAKDGVVIKKISA